MATLRVITIFGALVAMASPALAGMPPPEYDRNCGRTFNVPVPYGQAWATCDKLMKQHGLGRMDKSDMVIDGRPLYGCHLTSTNIIVFSFDTPALAKQQGRKYDAKMRSNTKTHENAHFCGWPSDHPDAR